MDGLLILMLLVGSSLAPSAWAQNVSQREQWRRPTRLAATSHGLMVGNRDSGSISWLSPALDKIQGEWAVVKRLADFGYLERHDSIVVADDVEHQLVALSWEADGWQVAHRAPVPAAPRDLLLLDDGRQLSVSSVWAQQLTLWSIEVEGSCGDTEAECKGSHGLRLTRRAELDLPFAPGLQCATPDQSHLIVADAWGSRLAIVQRHPLSVRSVVEIPGHNMRGMAISADGRELLIAHQMLNNFIPTTRDHVFWGNVLSNLVRSIPLAALLQDRPKSSDKPPRLYGSLHPIGSDGHAAGDPEELVVAANGDQLIAVAGTNELAYRPSGARTFRRLATGRRPSAVILCEDGRTAVVANRFDDSVSVVDLDQFIQRTVSLGPMPAETDVVRGERHFYDAALSLDGWFSCHSCHSEGHSCGLLNDNFGDATIGAPKRIPTLLGSHQTAPWTWNGSQPSLAAQVRKSLELTMRGTDRVSNGSELDARANELASFLATLQPPPARDATRRRTDASAVARGDRLFHKLECDRCHVPPTYTSPDVWDVGITDEQGLTQFNPPSLRGLSQRFSYLHDGRCGSLAELLRIHPQHGAGPLSADDEADLSAFLLSL
jgi:cytochrome c peroxidase